MKKYIFVKDDEIIKTYSIEFDEGNIKEVEKNIDKYYGLGELQEDIRTGFDLFYDPNLSHKKIKVISKEFFKTEKEFHYCDIILHDINLYKYKYYAYIPHPLSIICATIKESTNKLELSNSIKDLLDYNCCNKDEEKFVQTIISEIKFNRTDNLGKETTDFNEKTLKLRFPRGEKINNINDVNKKL